MGEAAFTIDNLCYSYPKGKQDVLNGMSFTIGKGEIFGLLGPSGAGKSTTQKILIKLLDGYRGQIRYFGRDLHELREAFYQQIGVGFELPVHFGKLSGWENMRYFADFYENQADIEALMRRVGLWEYRDMLVAQYSKGMKVRLNFVRALLNRPQVLFLDEVTNGLDPQNAKVIKDMIAEFKAGGGTVFLTTHLMNDVEQLCDRVAFCVNGRLHEIATPRELKMKYGHREVAVEYRDDQQLKRAAFALADLGTDPLFQKLLQQQTIETIHSGETTMEDIFIKVTGAALHE